MSEINRPGISETLVRLRLVPVEVFLGECSCGADPGYGLSDAVASWSDCNRAAGRIYRVDEPEAEPYRDPGETVEIWVNASDVDFFKRTFGGDSAAPLRVVAAPTVVTP